MFINSIFYSKNSISFIICRVSSFNKVLIKRFNCL
nr:MAG TPA: hypothetical protein [Bacteriophage sp.]